MSARLAWFVLIVLLMLYRSLALGPIDATRRASFAGAWGSFHDTLAFAIPIARRRAKC